MFLGPLIRNHEQLTINNLAKNGVKLIDAIFLGKKGEK